MAASKSKKKAEPKTQSPTSEQLEEIGKAIHNTTLNVYQVAERICGFKPDGDALFERLRSEQEMFKCQECNHWCGTDMESGMPDVCIECDCEQFAEEDCE